MFICEDCVKPKGKFWFIISLMSYGKCEICGEEKPCVDVNDYSKIKDMEREE